MSYYRKLYSCGELPSRAKLVYIYLYDRCDKEKKAWPSVKTIAKELRQEISNHYMEQEKL